MPQEPDAFQSMKISKEFVRRLARLAPYQKVRAIVMLRTDGRGRAIARRGLPGEREATLRAMRQQVESALPEIDHLLDRFGGERLSSGVDALGAVAVETTAAGIRGLTSLRSVRAVLEDQDVLFRSQRSVSRLSN
jgi:hypothetical protein